MWQAEVVGLKFTQRDRIAKHYTHNLLTYIILQVSYIYYACLLPRRCQESHKKLSFLKEKGTKSESHIYRVPHPPPTLQLTKKEQRIRAWGSNNVGCKSTRQQCQICEWL